MESFVLALGIIAGLAVGFILSERRVSTKARAAEKEAEKIIKKAQEDADKRQAFLRELEDSLKEREKLINKRGDETDKLRLEWERKNEEVIEIKDAIREIREKQEASLERIAKMSKEDAKEALIKLMEKIAKR